MASETPPDVAPRALLTEEGWVTARPPRLQEVLRRIVGFPKLVVEHYDLVWTSVRRELEARFQGTILGWIWPLIHPVFLFVVYYFIFTKLLDFKIPDLPPGQESAMGVYMFVGIVVWSTIAETLTRGTNSIVDNGNLIKKLSFPSEILPLNVVLVGLITLFFAVVVFLAGCFTPMWTLPGWHVAWLPLLLLLQGLMCYGLAMLLATLQVFLRDTLQVVTVLVTVWMFWTPLFWVPEMMGTSIRPFLGLIKANPFYHLVQAWRGCLMGDLTPDIASYGGPVSVVSVAAIPGHVATFSIWAVAAFALGYGFFILSQRRFADEV